MCDMLKLLHFEFCKLRQSKSLYICSGLLAVLTAFSVYTEKAMNDELGLDSVTTGIASLMEALPTSMIAMLMGIFVALFVCEDYTSGTIRNILTRGYTRLSVFASKFLTVLAAAVFMSFVCWAAAFITGTAFGGSGDGFGAEQVKILLCQLVNTLAFATLFFALSIMIQRSGGAIACCIVVPMVMTIILKLADTALAEREIELYKYWIDGLGHSIASVTVKSGTLKDAFWYSVIYIPVSLAVGWLVSRKKEY